MSDMNEGGAGFLSAAVELAFGRIDLCKCSACGGPRDNGHCCGECGGGYCDPLSEGGHNETIIDYINTHDTLVAQNLALKALLSETKAILETSSAVTDTVWYNDHTTMCDKIQLTLEANNDNT